MALFPKFSGVAVTPNIVSAGHVEYRVRPTSPVWINPFGVNAVREYPSDDGKVPATLIDMDDGSNYVVGETPRTVTNRLSKAVKERDEGIGP